MCMLGYQGLSSRANIQRQQVYADRDPDRPFVGYLGGCENRNHWAADGEQP